MISTRNRIHKSSKMEMGDKSKRPNHPPWQRTPLPTPTPGPRLQYIHNQEATHWLTFTPSLLPWCCVHLYSNVIFRNNI